MNAIVLDASALAALLSREPGWEHVDDVLGQAVISTVNLAEVAGIFSRRGGEGVDVRDMLANVTIERVPFDEELALDAGMLEPLTRVAGLSLGDRACLALARRLQAPAMTTDRAWSAVADIVGVTVRHIR